MTIHRRGLLTGGAVALAGTPGPIAALAEGVSPDTEILRLGALRERAKAHANIWVDDETLTARCEVVADIEMAIHAIPAQTFAGLAVKARLAYDVVPAPDPNQPLLEDVLASLLEDILQLAGSSQA